MLKRIQRFVLQTYTIHWNRFLLFNFGIRYSAFLLVTMGKTKTNISAIADKEFGDCYFDILENRKRVERATLKT